MRMQKRSSKKGSVSRVVLFVLFTIAVCLSSSWMALQHYLLTKEEAVVAVQPEAVVAQHEEPVATSVSDAAAGTSLRFPPISCAEVRSDRKQDLSLEYGMHKRQTVTDPSFIISLHDKKIDRVRWTIMKKGYYYETGMTALFAQILKGQPRAIVVDVGMNIGWFSLYSAAMGHKVFAFEPNRLNHYRMCESIELNQYSSSDVQVLPYGLGESENFMSMKWSGRNPGEASFLVEKGKEGTSSKVITLDAFSVEQGWLTTNGEAVNGNQIRLLKVDVEGFEAQVFRGCNTLLQSGVVENILMEFTLYRYKPEEARQMLLSIIGANYKLEFTGSYLGREKDDVYNYVTSTQTPEEMADALLNWIKVFKVKGDESLNLWWKKI